MITIGRFLKEKRINKKLSRRKLGQITKIKEGFIAAIEEEKWEKLPEKAIVAGFVKSISSELGLRTTQVMALFRRDYPQIPLKINPDPDISTKFVWSPKITFFLVSLGVVLLVSIYLLLQYISFITPPKLIVNAPLEGQRVSTTKVEVSGFTDPSATVSVNRQPVLVNEDGSFETSLEVDSNTKEIEVKSRSRSGKETVVRRTINVEFPSGEQ